MFVSIRTANIYLNQGTYEYKDGTYTIYTDNSYKTYDVDFVTDIVGDTGITKEEFEKLLESKGLTEKK